MATQQSNEQQQLKAPLSFSLIQSNQFVFLQINLDKKEFNQAQAEPELVITGDTVSVSTAEVTESESPATDTPQAEEGKEAATIAKEANVESEVEESARRIDFYAAPYMLKLRLNQDMVPVTLNKENGGKDLLWQKTYGAYLCRIQKKNFGEEFTGLEPDELASLVIPIEHEEEESLEGA